MTDTPDAPRQRGTAAIPVTPGQGVDTTITYAQATDTDPASGLTRDDQRAVEALPQGSALLVVQRGPNAGARFLLDSERTTAGRAADSDIFLDDVTVSRRHAEFGRVGEGYRVVDVGSLNGTYVNRQRIESAVLSAGDEVQIGKYRLVYHPSRQHLVPADGGGLAGVSSAAVAGRSRPSAFTIGEVLGVLRAEFPDVTISKIRFLEEQGLVEPDRTPSGYRKFSQAHVERLRHVLTLQRDHFLPLRVIREQLDAGAPGVPAAPGPAPFVRVLTAAERSGRGAPDAGSLADAAGADLSLVEELVRHGLVRPAGDGWFSADDIEVVRAAAALAAHGLEPRHLRGFRQAADKEVDLVEQVVAPLRRQGRAGAAGEVADTQREVAATCLRLHAALVAGSLGRR